MTSHVFKSIRNAFFGGLIVLLPLGITLFVVNFLIVKIGDPASSLFFGFFEDQIPDKTYIKPILNFISTIIVLILITFLGYFSRLFLVRIFFNITEKLIIRLPFISTVYSSVKQIVDTFSTQQKAIFQQVVLVEYPRKDMYAIGFLTSTARGETHHKTGQVVGN